MPPQVKMKLTSAMSITQIQRIMINLYRIIPIHGFNYCILIIIRSHLLKQIMDYHTDFMNVNLEILESVLYNTEKHIPKIKLTVEFDEIDKYNRFIERVNPTANEDDELISSDEDDEKEEEPTNSLPEIELVSEKDEEFMQIQKLMNLEESIILKQYYAAQISKIGKQTRTRVLVVPEKIKYFGKEYQDIESAKEMVYDIKKNIDIHKIKEWGKEIYESKFYSQKIEKANMNFIKIAEKYLVWYDETEIKDNAMDILEDAFTHKCHYLYPLFHTSPEIYRRFNEKYINAIIKTKGYLFNHVLKQHLNETYEPEYRIQLSKSQTELIIHCNIKQQLDMRQCQIKSLYDNYYYFFISYDHQMSVQDQNLYIENIDSITKYLSEKQIFFCLCGHILVIAYQKQSIKKLNETNEAAFMEKTKEEFINNIKQIFKFNVDCSIEILMDEEYGIDVDLGRDRTSQQESISKKLTMEDKNIDRLWVITPKNKKPEIFTKIIQYYVLNSFLNKNKKKTNQHNFNESVSETSIDASNRINDSTTMLIANNSVMEEGVGAAENNLYQMLPEDVKMDKVKSILYKYSRYFEDCLRQKKYDEDVSQLSKSKTSDFKFSDEISEQISLKYKVHDVKIPIKYLFMHQKLRERQKTEEIVTVFVKQNEGNSLYDTKSTQVYPFEKSSITKNNGWLLNIPKSSINEIQFQMFICNKENPDVSDSEIPSNVCFEPIKYLKFIKAL